MLGNIPENPSIFLQRLLNQLPEDFVIDGGNDGVYTSKLRGKLGKWMVTLIYDFNKNDNLVQIAAMDINYNRRQGTCLIDELNTEMTEVFINDDSPTREESLGLK
jgi:hypothetical protein